MSGAKSSSDESSSPATEPTAQPPQSGPDPADDRLATIRVASLPPVPRPPPPPSRAPRPAPSAPPPSGQTQNGGLSEGAGVARSDSSSRPTRTSWLQSLLASTLPSPGSQASSAETVRRARVAWACAVLAVALIVSALFMGLSAPPAESAFASNVVAALVIARALMSLGMLATGLTLLRMSERWLTAGRRETSNEAGSSARSSSTAARD
jgi:hypothetical protein